MNNTILWVGVVLLVLGVIGIIANWYPVWMWVLAVLGIVGIIWGWLAK